MYCKLHGIIPISRLLHAEERRLREVYTGLPTVILLRARVILLIDNRHDIEHVNPSVTKRQNEQYFQLCQKLQLCCGAASDKKWLERFKIYGPVG